LNREILVKRLLFKFKEPVQIISFKHKYYLK